MTFTEILHYQYLKTEDKRYFTFLNSVTQEINVYNMDLKQLAFKIPLACVRLLVLNTNGNFKGPRPAGQHRHSGIHLA